MPNDVRQGQGRTRQMLRLTVLSSLHASQSPPLPEPAGATTDAADDECQRDLVCLRMRGKRSHAGFFDWVMCAGVGRTGFPGLGSVEPPESPRSRADALPAAAGATGGAGSTTALPEGGTPERQVDA